MTVSMDKKRARSQDSGPFHVRKRVAGELMAFEFESLSLSNVNNGALIQHIEDGTLLYRLRAPIQLLNQAGISHHPDHDNSLHHAVHQALDQDSHALVVGASHSHEADNISRAGGQTESQIDSPLLQHQHQQPQQHQQRVFVGQGQHPLATEIVSAPPSCSASPLSTRSSLFSPLSPPLSPQVLTASPLTININHNMSLGLEANSVLSQQHQQLHQQHQQLQPPQHLATVAGAESHGRSGMGASEEHDPGTGVKIVNMRQRKWNSAEKQWQEWHEVCAATHSQDLGNGTDPGMQRSESHHGALSIGSSTIIEHDPSLDNVQHFSGQYSIPNGSSSPSLSGAASMDSIQDSTHLGRQQSMHDSDRHGKLVSRAPELWDLISQEANPNPSQTQQLYLHQRGAPVYGVGNRLRSFSEANAYLYTQQHPHHAQHYDGDSHAFSSHFFHGHGPGSISGSIGGGQGSSKGNRQENGTTLWRNEGSVFMQPLDASFQEEDSIVTTNAKAHHRHRPMGHPQRHHSDHGYSYYDHGDLDFDADSVNLLQSGKSPASLYSLSHIHGNRSSQTDSGSSGDARGVDNRLTQHWLATLEMTALNGSSSIESASNNRGGSSQHGRFGPGVLGSISSPSSPLMGSRQVESEEMMRSWNHRLFQMQSGCHHINGPVAGPSSGAGDIEGYPRSSQGLYHGHAQESELTAKHEKQLQSHHEHSHTHGQHQARFSPSLSHSPSALHSRSTFHQQHQNSHEDVAMGEDPMLVKATGAMSTSTRSSSPSPCLSMAPTVSRPLSISFSQLSGGASMLGDLTEHEHDDDMEL
ncbi:hypothetical protein BGW38_005819 [Lunasporangiospora selenospora]|uniref:Uncharacterized protein n=1 Tax=Lunasporangiospora selenospora TaxID=979761 RepID=A0A9P6KIQ2_9FUNG|nr:hypothetical protein BGW38_005819 [Lunasporangiospora selenospora]